MISCVCVLQRVAFEREMLCYNILGSAFCLVFFFFVVLGSQGCVCMWIGGRLMLLRIIVNSAVEDAFPPPPLFRHGLPVVIALKRGLRSPVLLGLIKSMGLWAKKAPPFSSDSVKPIKRY